MKSMNKKVSKIVNFFFIKDKNGQTKLVTKKQAFDPLCTTCTYHFSVKIFSTGKYSYYFDSFDSKDIYIPEDVFDHFLKIIVEIKLFDINNQHDQLKFFNFLKDLKSKLLQTKQN